MQQGPAYPSMPILAKCRTLLTNHSFRSLSSLTKGSSKDLPTTVKGGAAFDGDLKSVTGLGLGDGINNHTGKWLQARKHRIGDSFRPSMGLTSSGLNVLSAHTTWSHPHFQCRMLSCTPLKAIPLDCSTSVMTMRV